MAIEAPYFAPAEPERGVNADVRAREGRQLTATTPEGGERARGAGAVPWQTVSASPGVTRGQWRTAHRVPGALPCHTCDGSPAHHTTCTRCTRLADSLSAIRYHKTVAGIRVCGWISEPLRSLKAEQRDRRRDLMIVTLDLSWERTQRRAEVRWEGEECTRSHMSGLVAASWLGSGTFLRHEFLSRLC